MGVHVHKQRESALLERGHSIQSSNPLSSLTEHDESAEINLHFYYTQKPSTKLSPDSLHVPREPPFSPNQAPTIARAGEELAGRSEVRERRHLT
jgi:hypothetical protein